MKQSRNSWNIKFMMMLFENYPKSLCTLFWSQVWTFIWGAIFFPFFIVGKLLNLFLNKKDKMSNYFNLSLAGFGILITGLLTFSGIYIIFDFDHKSILFELGLIFWVIIVLLIISILISYSIDNSSSSKSLVGKYIKAKKSKLCPIIEWED